jgi:thioredoxin 1
MSAAIKHVSDATFDKDVLQSGNPVLVDFWAEWCGPCKMFAPVLDEIAKEYGGKVTVAKLDIDANPSTPGKYGIRGIPTLILYKGGQPHAQKVGALTKSQLTAFLDSNL